MKYCALLLAAGLAYPQITADETTIRVNVNLIQLDVTVFDKTGKHIPNLTADQFELTRDGKRQNIKSVLWVGEKPPVPTVPASLSTPSAVLPARQIEAKEVRRTIALLIDDLSMSFSGIYYARDALKKFVEENVQPGDLVALFRSSSGAAVLQQFTTDKRQLLAAIERTRFRSINSVDSLAPINNDPNEDSSDQTLAQMAMAQRLREEVSNRQRQDITSAGMLGSANAVVKGLRELPGRKSLILFSESLQITDIPQSFNNPGMTSAMAMAPGASGGSRDRTLAAIRNLVDIANRSGVVFYTIDPRGLVFTGLTALDTPSGNIRRAQGQLQQRATDFSLSRDGLAILAEETGGVFYKDRNDLAGALKEALNDQEGYYLIAFQPDDETFEKSKGGAHYNNIRVKVKHPGAKVRYRHGFYSIPDDERLPKPSNPIYSAMNSPFRSTEIPLKITPIFFDDEKTGSYIRTLFHVDPSNFTYKEIPADPEDKNQTPWQQAVVDELVILLNENGQAVETVSKTHTLKARGQMFETMKRQGLIQELDVPLKKPGAYQLRAAMMDQSSHKTGSSTQFIEAPDLKSKRLGMSDLVLSNEAWIEKADPTGGPALRIMHPGARLNYAAFVYNARLNKEGTAANLETQMILYRDGKAIYTGKKSPFEAKGHTEGKSLSVTGNMQLGKNIAPGEYVLQLAIHDLEANKKQSLTVRSIDFEIRP